MEGTAALPKNIKDERCWREFKAGDWCTTIDAPFHRAQRHALSRRREIFGGAVQRTKAVWAKLQPYFQEERKKGVLCRRRKNALNLIGAQGGIHRPG